MKNAFISLLMFWAILFTINVNANETAVDNFVKPTLTNNVLQLAQKFCNDETARRSCYMSFEMCTDRCKASGEPLEGKCVQNCRDEMNKCIERC